MTTPQNETVREPVNESRSSLNNGSEELRISLQGLMSLESGCLKRYIWINKITEKSNTEKTTIGLLKLTKIASSKMMVSGLSVFDGLLVNQRIIWKTNGRNNCSAT